MPDSREIPFNPFVSGREIGSPEVAALGSIILSREEVPHSVAGFQELAAKHEPGSREEAAFLAAAEHVSWVVRSFGRSQIEVIDTRRLSNESMELVFPPRGHR